MFPPVHTEHFCEINNSGGMAPASYTAELKTIKMQQCKFLIPPGSYHILVINALVKLQN